MFGTPVKSGLTFAKVLGGISKTLSVANQIIPLYQQARPMIHNAKTILSVLKETNKPNSSSSNNKKTISNTNSNLSDSKNISSNIPSIKSGNPVFFL